MSLGVAQREEHGTKHKPPHASRPFCPLQDSRSNVAGMSLARTGSLGYRQHRLTCIPALHLVGMNPRLLARSPPVCGGSAALMCGRETVSQSACQCTIADDVCASYSQESRKSIPSAGAMNHWP